MANGCWDFDFGFFAWAYSVYRDYITFCTVTAIAEEDDSTGIICECQLIYGRQTLKAAHWGLSQKPCREIYTCMYRHIQRTDPHL
jgi:hypothetical protein